MNTVNISGRKIGHGHSPFIIAELSGNHDQSLDKALDIVRAAAQANVHAIKIQTYTADTITIDHKGGLFDITEKDSPWHGETLYSLYQKAYTPWEWHKEIFDLANQLGLIAFSSPFDETAVDFLEELNVPAYKIASFESNHFPLLKKVAQTGKPILISSGTSSINELYESIHHLKKHGAKEIIIFKCTSTYPATPSTTNLNTIPVLQSIFPDSVIGLSDHTLGIGAAVASVALGARVIEKHITLRRSDGGVDSSFSLEPDEFTALTIETERAWQALGDVQLAAQKSEAKSKQFKRSIYVVKDIEKGQTWTRQNLRVIRPGAGAHPRYYDMLLGTKAKKSYSKGEPYHL